MKVTNVSPNTAHFYKREALVSSNSTDSGRPYHPLPFPVAIWSFPVTFTESLLSWQHLAAKSAVVGVDSRYSYPVQ